MVHYDEICRRRAEIVRGAAGGAVLVAPAAVPVVAVPRPLALPRIPASISTFQICAVFIIIQFNDIYIRFGRVINRKNSPITGLSRTAGHFFKRNALLVTFTPHLFAKDAQTRPQRSGIHFASPFNPMEENVFNNIGVIIIRLCENIFMQ